MTTVQKWLTILGGLGALYIVSQNPKGFTALANGIQKITAGSVAQIATGGKAG